MAHGLGGNRECALDPYARRFATAGFYVLLFDYRNIGASDGTPRQVIAIERQLQDWASAVRFVRGLDGIDPRRIGLWGTSLSGGHVVTAAARDGQIAAISAQCPMLDGHASSRMLRRSAGIGAIARLLWAALADTARAALGLSPYYVPLVGRPGERAAMVSRDAYDGMEAITPPSWRNEIAARIFLSMPLYRPVRHARAVTCPALLIACERDSLVSIEATFKTARRMGDRARILTLPIGHFDIYVGEWFERASAEQVAFFTAALGAKT
jgi:pimeloyl-ACP methyl ester carboxylesterase